MRSSRFFLTLILYFYGLQSNIKTMQKNMESAIIATPHKGMLSARFPALIKAHPGKTITTAAALVLLAKYGYENWLKKSAKKPKDTPIKLKEKKIPDKIAQQSKINPESTEQKINQNFEQETTSTIAQQINPQPQQQPVIQEQKSQIVQKKGLSEEEKESLREMLQKFDKKYAPPQDIIDFIETNKEKIEKLSKNNASRIAINGSTFYVKSDPTRKINAIRINNCIEKNKLSGLAVAEKYIYKVNGKRLVFSKKVESEDDFTVFDSAIVKQWAAITEKTGFADYNGNNIMRDISGKYIIIDTGNNGFYTYAGMYSQGDKTDHLNDKYCKARYLHKMLNDLRGQHRTKECTQEEFEDIQKNITKDGDLAIESSGGTIEHYPLNQIDELTIKLWLLSREAKQWLEDQISYWAKKCSGARTNVGKAHDQEYPFVDITSKEFNYDGNIDLNKVEKALWLESQNKL